MSAPQGNVSFASDPPLATGRLARSELEPRRELVEVIRPALGLLFPGTPIWVSGLPRVTVFDVIPGRVRHHGPDARSGVGAASSTFATVRAETYAVSREFAPFRNGGVRCRIGIKWRRLLIALTGLDLPPS